MIVYRKGSKGGKGGKARKATTKKLNGKYINQVIRTINNRRRKLRKHVAKHPNDLQSAKLL